MTENLHRRLTLPPLVVLVIATMAAACGSSESRTAAAEGAAEAAVATIKPGYPAPRFPAYLRPPKTVEELMPRMRQVVRARSGFEDVGLDSMKAGDTIGLVVSVSADEMTLQALQRALEERQVHAVILRDHELNGVSREDAEALWKTVRAQFTTEHGWLEEATWIERDFPQPDAVKAWLKERRPDLYQQVFPAARELSPHLQQINEKMTIPNTGQNLLKYFAKHPEMKGVFWGKGGSGNLRRALHPQERRFLGRMTYDNRWDVMGAWGDYPADVWRLAEEQTIEPIRWIDHVRITDPEGTDISFDLTEEIADRWSRGVYERGFLYMFPSNATGRFAYSFVNYPALSGEWLAREPTVMPTGVIAATRGQTGFIPRWELLYKDGYLREVKGGGLAGDLLREFMQYPRIHDLSYPFSSDEHKGFFYLYSIAQGTHPKAFRAADANFGAGGAERFRAGVLVWGVGNTVQHQPGSTQKSQKLLDFAAQYNLPRKSSFHSMTYLSTYKVHLRNSGKSVKLVDKGHMTSLDNPEVRALASRYGNPDVLLTEDWIPELPGINRPGDYEAYAKAPFEAVRQVNELVNAGTYSFFYPPAGGANKPATPTTAAKPFEP